MMAQYNLRNPAVKRLMKEAEELCKPTEEYYAQPLEDNLFEWHFTLRGPPNTEYDGGIYHGRITLPPDYPLKPPSIILLTPNGRFETNKKICLSISGYHPESWQPSWSIRTALLAIIGFMPTHGNGALGSLDYSAEERRELAIMSQNFNCPECGSVKDIILKPEQEDEENDIDIMTLPEGYACQTLDEPTGESGGEDSSEKLGSDTDSSGDQSTLFHRRKVSAARVVEVSEHPVGAHVTCEFGTNLLFTVFVAVIVIIILVLFLRRIFSM